jgi:hypothetical protein
MVMASLPLFTSVTLPFSPLTVPETLYVATAGEEELLLAPPRPTRATTSATSPAHLKQRKMADNVIIVTNGCWRMRLQVAYIGAQSDTT